MPTLHSLQQRLRRMNSSARRSKKRCHLVLAQARAWLRARARARARVLVVVVVVVLARLEAFLELNSLHLEAFLELNSLHLVAFLELNKLQLEAFLELNKLQLRVQLVAPVTLLQRRQGAVEARARLQMRTDAQSAWTRRMMLMKWTAMRVGCAMFAGRCTAVLAWRTSVRRARAQPAAHHSWSRRRRSSSGCCAW